MEQYRAGAQYLQVFESNSGELTPREFRDFLLPYLQGIARKVRCLREDAATIGVMGCSGGRWCVLALVLSTVTSYTRDLHSANPRTHDR